MSPDASELVPKAVFKLGNTKFGVCTCWERRGLLYERKMGLHSDMLGYEYELATFEA